MELMRWDIINALIEKNNYQSYLEIGYYKGWSFDRVECNSKRAVDPNPCKTPEQEKTSYGKVAIDTKYIADGIMKVDYIVKMSSDDFFAEVAHVDGYHQWDIIFIDGLHEAEQVYRDIENSLKHLSPNGTIVLHDCNPPKYEHTTTGIDGCWTGDTYKAVIKFIDNYETEYSFHTVDTDWGVGIIQKGKWGSLSVMLPNSQGARVADSFKGIKRKSEWEFFEAWRKELINLITPERFKEIYL